MALVDRVVRRLKLRDLRLLETVVQSKSIAKAAARLNITAPAVSKALSELEHMIGARLLDRSRQGIEPTVYGQALIRRGETIFDEIYQGVSEIESLADPQAGEVRIAASIPMAAGILPVIIGKLRRQYPRISIYAREIPIGALQFQESPYRDVRARTVDMAFGPIVKQAGDDDLETEFIFGDPLFVATGKQNRMRSGRTLRLHDLEGEQWCLPPPDSPAGVRCVDTFRANGMEFPRKTVTAISVHLQLGLLASERFFTMFPGSLMRFGANRLSIKALPIELKARPLPVGIITLKGRTISPAARIFIDSAKLVAKPFAHLVQ
jgi:DNA-binding transcriptional LysR family regulator